MPLPEQPNEKTDGSRVVWGEPLMVNSFVTPELKDSCVKWKGLEGPVGPTEVIDHSSPMLDNKKVIQQNEPLPFLEEQNGGCRSPKLESTHRISTVGGFRELLPGKVGRTDSYWPMNSISIRYLCTFKQCRQKSL